MREPRALPSAFGVLNLSMTIVIALTITVGFYGYIQFGDDAKGSVTLNVDGWYVDICICVSVYRCQLIEGTNKYMLIELWCDISLDHCSLL